MKIRRVTHHGRTRWILDTRIQGKRQRQMFKTKALAETEAETLQGQRRAAGDAWLAMSSAERLEVISFMDDLRRQGTTLGQVWRAWRAGQIQTEERPSITLENAIKETVAAKVAANRRRRYLDGLQDYLLLFARGRESMPVSAIKPQDISQWYAERREAPSTRQGNLGRLGSLFGHCLRMGYIDRNPCSLVERAIIERRPPVIFTPRQAQRLLVASRRRFQALLPYLVLAMFAGIRKEELQKLSWSEIDLDRKLVRVDAAAAKTRQRRLVPLEPAAVGWLRGCEPKTGPICPLNLTVRLRKIRKLAKISWHQDILRHTAASYLMALHQDAGKVANWLGNSASILHNHYRELVSPEDSRRFWASAPSKLHISGTVSAGRPD